MKRRFSKIYIVGSVASGKTTLARELSNRLGIPWYELDNVVWVRCPGGDVKRPADKRDSLFESIITSRQWIIEDVLRPCFEKGLRAADVIILLDPPKRRKRRFAFFRWIKQKFQMEKSNYKHTVRMLKSMYRWIWDYERNRDDFMKRLEPYRAKVIALSSPDDIEEYLR